MKLTRFFKKCITKSPTLLGIDVDHQSLRLVELNKVGSTYFLHSCIQSALPSQNSAENFSWDHPEFSDFLKQVVQKANLATHRVALALPHTSVLFKTIELDKTLNEAEIAIQVRDHAEQYFNYPLSELMMDFELLGTSKNHPDLREVRWVAARRVEIASRINALTIAGLTAAVVEVDSFSLQRAVAFFIKKKQLQLTNVAVIHIYVSYILLTIFHQGLPIHTRVENYAVNTHEATALAISVAIMRVLQTSTTNNLSLILLSGSDIPADLLNRIQAQAGITTQYLDIFSVLEKSIYDEKYQSHTFLVGVGLAMWMMV